MDPERLASLMDGRLPDAERAQLLAELDDQDLAILADAAAALEVDTPARRAMSAI